MPWTLVESLTPSIPVHTGTVSGNAGTILVGDKTTGDIFDVEITFPSGVVTNNFAFNSANIAELKVIHVGVDASENKATVRLESLNDGLSRSGLRFTFGTALYEDSPNYLVNIVDF